MIFRRKNFSIFPPDILHWERARRYRRVRTALSVDREKVGDCRVVRRKIASGTAGKGQKLLFLADLHFNGDEKVFRRIAAIRQLAARLQDSSLQSILWAVFKARDQREAIRLAGVSERTFYRGVAKIILIASQPMKSGVRGTSSK